MPYAKRKRSFSRKPSYGRGANARRAAASRIARSYRRYKATKKPTRTLARRNTYKVAKLRRNVKFLMSARYGTVQSNYHHMEVVNQQILLVTNKRPALFDAIDFTKARTNTSGGVGAQITNYGGRIWQRDINTPGSTAIIPRAHWLDLQPKNPFYDRQRLDIPDGGVYKALSSKYTFKITGLPDLDHTRVRITFFTVKASQHIPNTNTTLQKQDQLPFALGFGHFDDMCDPTQNRFNPVYHKVIADKWLWFDNKKNLNFTQDGTMKEPGADGIPGNADDVVTDTINIAGQLFNIITQATGISPMHKFATFRFNHSKVVKQDRTAPAFDAPTDSPPDTGVDMGDFGPLNVPLTQPLWCLVSTDDETIVGDSLKVEIARTVYWRDKLGQAAY